MLDIALLAQVEDFKDFLGIMYNHNTVDSPDLLFFVKYYDGSSGVIRCGSLLCGRPKCVRDHFLLHMKVCRAKELVPWESLGTNEKFNKDNMLRIAWATILTEGSRV